MKCCSLLLHCGQANDRKSWRHMLGSIAVNLMGEPHAAHSGPWFCLSSITIPSCLARGGLLGSMLNRRSQSGTHPLHRMGLGDDLIDVIAVDALKRAPLESETRRLDACQDHWA